MEVYAQWKSKQSNHKFLHLRTDGRVRFSHWEPNDYQSRPRILENPEVKFKLTLFY